MRELDTHELAWAAGLYDGEGCTYFSKNGNGSGRIVLLVQQKDREVLDRFRSAILNFGMVYGPYAHGEMQGRCPMYVWKIARFEHVQVIIGLLWNRLSTLKKEQIKRVLKKHHGARTNTTEYPPSPPPKN